MAKAKPGVYRVTEIIGTSTKSWEEAAKTAVETAALTNLSVRTTARTGAPIDLTGYWVAVITEDWRWRMLTPPKGDYASIPLNMAAKKVGDAWDPAKDEAAGDQCKGYGAPGVMRQPGRAVSYSARMRGSAVRVTRRVSPGARFTRAKAARRRGRSPEAT